MFQSPLFITGCTVVRVHGATAASIQRCARRWNPRAALSSSHRFRGNRPDKERAVTPRSSNDDSRWDREQPQRSHSNQRYSERRNSRPDPRFRNSNFREDDRTHRDSRPDHKEYNRSNDSYRKQPDTPVRFDEAHEYGDKAHSAYKGASPRRYGKNVERNSDDRWAPRNNNDDANDSAGWSDRRQRRGGRGESADRWSPRKNNEDTSNFVDLNDKRQRSGRRDSDDRWSPQNNSDGASDSVDRNDRRQRWAGRRESGDRWSPRNNDNSNTFAKSTERNQWRGSRRESDGRWARQERYNDYGNDEPRDRFRERTGRGGEQDYQQLAPMEPTEIQEALSSGDILLYGLQSVWQALGAERRTFHTLYLQHTPGAGAGGTVRKAANSKLRGEVEERAGALELRVVHMDRGELNALCGNRPHQGAVLRCGTLEYEMTQALGPGAQGDVVLALDEVSDPQNLGALLRSAMFLGARAFAVCARNSAPLSPAVSRASAGVAEVTPVLGIESMPRFLRRAREEGWRVLGAAADPGSVDLRGVERGPPTILVLGSEGDGLRTMVRQCCDALVSIKRAEGCGDHLDSLNVSVAGALALYHLRE